MVNEAEGTFLVMDFSVEGEIPDGGVTVNLEGDAARIMEQFDLVQAGIDQETGNIFYRFDEDFKPLAKIFYAMIKGYFFANLTCSDVQNI